jgi:hypothetical protein
LLFVAFIAGCGLGAAFYSLLARSELATAQGVVADSVGDVVDSIKAKLGVGPVWRPEYRHLVERPLADDGTEADERGGRQPAHVADESAEWPEEPYDDRERLVEPEPEWQADAPLADAPLAIEDKWGEHASLPVVTDRVDGTGLDAVPVEAIGEAAELPEPNLLIAPSDGIVPVRPVGLAAPRNGVPDNLQKIWGIGGRNEQLLNGLGIYHFGQIASWTPAEVKWIAERLAFPERIERDDWIGQAMVLATGGDTGFVKSAERRRERRRQRDEWDPVEDVGVDGD